MLTKTLAAAVLGAAIISAPARAETPGVTSTEVKIGATFPFSGPASPLSNTGKGLIAYINAINDRGGISGRKINLITYDDAYSPPKTVEQTRKLIESDEVAFLFGPLGTPGISATIKYVNAKKVPHLFVVSGVTRFTNFAEFPMTTTGLPSYDPEGRIYAKYIDSGTTTPPRLGGRDERDSRVDLTTRGTLVPCIKTDIKTGMMPPPISGSR
ncbi:ABC-type branched-subunit amino acid transport system substrate-binding protein [Bradyrhizobium liaoningense]